MRGLSSAIKEMPEPLILVITDLWIGAACGVGRPRRGGDYLCSAALFGLGLLCSPAFALRVGNPLARLGAQRAALLPLFGSLRGFFGFASCPLDGDFSGVGQQGANFRETSNFGVD